MSNRGDLLRVRARFKETQAEQEPRLNRFLALMGNGEGDLAVPGSPLFVYVRVQGRGVVECLNTVAPLRNDLPIIVGYDFKKPDTLQVLSIYEGGMSSFGPYAYLPAHHQAHEFQNDDGGDDVVWVQKQQILPLLVYPQAPPTMFVEVYGGWYQWDTDWHYFETTTSADLTAHVPVVLPNEARFILISIDGAAETIQVTPGGIFPAFWPPPDREDMVPAPPAGHIPLAAIYLPFGTTAIPWDNIYDVRLIFSGGGAMSVGAAPRDASYVTMGLDPILSAERILIAGPDMDIVDGGAGGNAAVGRAGDLILLFDSGGAVLAEYACSYVGLQAALAAAGEGDVVQLPHRAIDLTNDITITTNVTLTSITSSGIKEASVIINQYPLLHHNGDVGGTLITLQEGAVLEKVKVNYIVSVGVARSAVTLTGADSIARRCGIVCTQELGATGRGVYLQGDRSVVEDCIVLGKATADGFGVGAELENASCEVRRSILEGTFVAMGGTGTGLLVSAGSARDCCVRGSTYGLRVYNTGTGFFREGYCSGGTADIIVEVGSALSVYSAEYSSLTNLGTFTQLPGDRAGNQRDEVITGDWNINAGEFGLPSGGAFPGAPQDGDVFYRTDTDTLYVFDGAAWDVMGGVAGALPAVAAAGYALVSDGVNSWAADQTPLWTGEHSFEAGIAFVGASGVNEITIPDNTAIALEILDAGGLEYLRINSEDANPYFLIDPAAAGVYVGIGVATTAHPFQVKLPIANLYEAVFENSDANGWGVKISTTNNDNNKYAFSIYDIADSVHDFVVTNAGNVIISGHVDPVSASGQDLGDATHRWDLYTQEVYFGGATGTNVITLIDNLANALYIADDGDADICLQIVTTTGSEEVIFNAGGDDVDFTVQAVGVADALQVQGADGQITLGLLTAGFVKSSAAGVLSVALEVALAELAGYVRGSIIRGGAADWEAYALAGAAGFALVSTATDIVWDQTPAWTGEHSFAAGIAFTGASGANEITVPDNIAIALELLDAGGLEHMRVVSTDAAPGVVFYSAGGGMLGVGDGASVTTDRWLDIDGTLSAAGTNYGLVCSPSLGADQIFYALYTRADIDAGVTAPTAVGLNVVTPSLGGGAVITVNYGILIGNMTSGITNYSIYTGTAQSYFGGNVGIGVAPTKRFDVLDDAAADYVARFFNDGDNVNRHVLWLQGGADNGAAVGTTNFVTALDGNADVTGRIQTVNGVFQLIDVSDERRKTNIKDTKLVGLDIIKELRVRDYNWKANPNGPVMTSFVAQEAQKVYPAMISGEPGEPLMTSRATLIPILTKAVQELDARLTSIGG